MRPVNIFALTRVTENDRLQKLERQMSGRGEYLKIKEWEIECLRLLSEHLRSVDEESCAFEYYYSFQIPKLGKEFDLLRISEDTVVNIELKSRAVADSAVKKQLELNRYYLSSLGKNIRSYTYLRGTEQLMRLTNGGRLIDATWEELSEDLRLQGRCFTGDIESLFKEEKYLISPLTDPDRFLRRDYFLTSQQRDIKRQILGEVNREDEVTRISSIKQVENEENAGLSLDVNDCVRNSPKIFGFSGLPGTGKTLLLYDLAMELSEKQCVCVLHYGSYPKELKRLDDILKRVDFYNCSPSGMHFDRDELHADYVAILVDEGHRIPSEEWDLVLAYANEAGIPVIVSYDREDVLAEEERPEDGSEYIENTRGIVKYRLTNRIRMNNELSSFIQCVMRPAGRYNNRDYPSVRVLYANDEAEAKVLLDVSQHDGYIFITNTQCVEDMNDSTMDIRDATCREFDRVVMPLYYGYYYDERGYLRGSAKGLSVRDIYHGLSRARECITLIVVDDYELFDVLLSIVKGKN